MNEQEKKNERTFNGGYEVLSGPFVIEIPHETFEDNERCRCHLSL